MAEWWGAVMVDTDDMRLVGEPSPHLERPSSFTADYNIFDHGQHLHEKELVFLDAETMRRREETIRRESGRVRIVKPMLRRSPNWE